MALKIGVIVCAHNEARQLPRCDHPRLAQPMRICRSRDLISGCEANDGRSHMTKFHVSDVGIDPAIDNAVRRAQSDFLEMPGLRLTLPQAARLWAYDAGFCSEVLAMLVKTRFLIRSRDGFIRAENRT